MWSAAFSRDGSRMATCSDDATLRLWECRFARGFREPSWRLQATLSGHHEMTIYSVDWSADGLLATGEGAADSRCCAAFPLAGNTPKMLCVVWELPAPLYRQPCFFPGVLEYCQLTVWFTATLEALASLDAVC